MATGTSSYDGLALPLLGEYEQVQETAATDMVTLTLAGTPVGDFQVFQNAAGVELNVTDVLGHVTINLTSTTAITAGDNNLNAFLITASSVSILNSVIGYNTGGGSEVGTAESFFAVHGSKAPSYFVSVGATAVGVGAAADNGFVETATRYASAPSTSITYGALKVLLGSKVYYIPIVPDTGMVDT